MLRPLVTWVPQSPQKCLTRVNLFLSTVSFQRNKYLVSAEGLVLREKIKIKKARKPNLMLIAGAILG